MKKVLLISLAFLMLGFNSFAGWEMLNPKYGQNPYNSVFFADQNYGYAVGQIGAIIKTNNGGTTWHKLVSGTTMDLHSVWFTHADTGYAVGYDANSGGVCKTTDGGATWVTINLGSYFFLESVCFANTKTGFASGTHGSDGVIVKTTALMG